MSPRTKPKAKKAKPAKKRTVKPKEIKEKQDTGVMQDIIEAADHALFVASVKQSIGRPTKYRDEYVGKLIDYFMGSRPYRTVKTIAGPREIPVDLPTLAEFALIIGVHRDTLHEWENAKDEKGKLKHPAFSDAIKKAKLYQEHLLVTNTLRKNYDKTFGIFTAKNVLGWKDVQHIKDEREVSYDDIEAEADDVAGSAEEARNQVK